MKKIYFIGLLVFVCLIGGKSYFENSSSCPKPEIIVNIENKVTRENIKYNDTKSISELSAMSKRKGGHTFGLFTSDVVSNAGIEVDNNIKNGCPSKITVNMVIDFNPIVYVANEYTKGTKDYNYILSHENEHVNITVESNQEYLSRLKKEIYDYASLISIQKPDNEEEMVESGKQIISSLKMTINHYVQGLNNFIDGKQNNFDAEEEKKGYFRGYF